MYILLFTKIELTSLCKYISNDLSFGGIRNLINKS